jgi:hypothetical protein
MMVTNGVIGRPSVPAVDSGWRGVVAACLRRVGLALATGYILLFFAERMFWSHWRPEDDAGSFLATWLVYSIGAEICLLTIRTYRVRDIWAMFLVGALLGWLVEGVFTMTFFGADGIPFPFTIAWTGLSWHALIVVVIGWYGMYGALRRSFRHTALMSAGLGLFWGGWSIFWDTQSPPGTLVAFVTHAFSTTFALILAYTALPALQVSRLRPSRIERVCLAVLVLLFFFGVTVAQFNWIALVTLPPLFAVIFLALRRNASMETRPDFLALIGQGFPLSRTAAIFLMPAIACAIHEGCRIAELSAQTNLLVFAVTLPAGAIAFVVSAVKVLRRPRGGASFAIQ